MEGQTSGGPSSFPCGASSLERTLAASPSQRIGKGKRRSGLVCPSLGVESCHLPGKRRTRRGFRSGGMGKAKRASIFIRLVSAAGTGFFYVKRKNPRRITEKLEFRKYGPRVNKHVLFTEAKMK
uniref:Uncharacterized protein n=1 Tax=Avena sativa TaxID=4498 RepID=A0ACD5VUQ7_AVESA